MLNETGRVEVLSVKEWLRAEFVGEQQSGFARLCRIPDTHVIRFLDHYSQLDHAQQSALMEILVDWAAYNLLGTPPPVPVYEQFAQASDFPGRGGLRYTGVNLLAGLIKENKPGGLQAFFQSQNLPALALVLPENLIREMAELVPAKPAHLRRLVSSTFAKLFAPQVTDIGSEMWRYEGHLNGCDVKLHIRYSAKMLRPQLAYHAEVRGKGRVIASPNLCFESMFGVGFGQWNYITMENAERSVTLLAELVTWLASLPERLPPGCCPTSPT